MSVLLLLDCSNNAKHPLCDLVHVMFGQTISECKCCSLCVGKLQLKIVLAQDHCYSDDLNE